ncbi:MAG TPA: hypothetical protein VFS21_01485 [Roseiflexaceae bacterium]|nr:hypothetical protein [Roseiflexaceae bacterium]
MVRLFLAAVALAALLSGCGTATGSLPAPTAPPATAVPAPEPSAPPPTAAPDPAEPLPTPPAASDGAIVTLRVADSETYRILLTDPADIEAARRLLAGEQAPSIPNGRVVRGDPGVNTGYSWHIDPDSLEFVEVTIEVCDGKPSDVEQEIITSEQFCPWSAKVVALDEGGPTTADAPLVSLSRSGGIAGISETITVYASGRVTVRDRSGQEREGQTAPADLEALRALLASPELAQAQSNYQASGADMFVYELIVPGSGKSRTIRTMDGAQHPEAVGRLIGELSRLRPVGD